MTNINYIRKLLTFSDCLYNMIVEMENSNIIAGEDCIKK